MRRCSENDSLGGDGPSRSDADANFFDHAGDAIGTFKGQAERAFEGILDRVGLRGDPCDPRCSSAGGLRAYDSPAAPSSAGVRSSSPGFLSPECSACSAASFSEPPSELPSPRRCPPPRGLAESSAGESDSHSVHAPVGGGALAEHSGAGGARASRVSFVDPDAFSPPSPRRRI